MITQNRQSCERYNLTSFLLIQVLFQILSYLSAVELCRTAETYTQLYEAAIDDHLWKNLYLVGACPEICINYSRERWMRKRESIRQQHQKGEERNLILIN